MIKESDQILLDRGKKWPKQLGQFLLGPVALIFTALAVILGVFGDDLVALYNHHENAYLISVGIVAGGYFIVAIITIGISTIIFSKDRNREIIEVIQKQPEPCRNLQNELKNIENTALHLQGVVTETAIKKGIIPRRALDDLEGSINKDRSIYIMTSRFILEKTDDFRNVIIRNFRKGVKYIYYIPKTASLQKDYFGLVHEWFQEFAYFMNSNEEAIALKGLSAKEKGAGHAWNPAYIKLLTNALTAHNMKSGDEKENKLKQVSEETKKLFINQLETYELDDNLFFVTVAMYEVNSGCWKAIIKLPTESSTDPFTAFSVSGTGTLETSSNFVLKIEKLRGDSAQILLKDSVFDC